MPFQPSLSLGQLDGLNGFTIIGGNPGDYLGRSVRPAGDVNGDGVDDFIIGSYSSDAAGPDAGSAYVVFGRTGGFGPLLDLTTLDGTNGFRLDGAAPGHLAGLFVSSAGDLNGDGFDDLVVDAYRAETNGRYSGGAWVVFGKATPFAATTNLGSLTAAEGFRINSAGPYATIRIVAGLAGDINGDGLDDLLLTSPYNTPTSGYVLFGKAGGFGSEVNLAGLGGADGFRMTGAFSTGFSGGPAGDVNGDGHADLLISSRQGISYVVFGRSAAQGPFDADLALDDLDGANGFIITSGGWSESAAGAGDINNDGFDDLVIGSPFDGSGTAYVVFGRASGPASFDVAALDGTHGFRIDGVSPGNALGIWVDAAGDLDADGIDDLAIGAVGYNGVAGAAYVIFGRDTAISGAFNATFDLNSLTGANGLRFDGVGFGDLAGGQVTAAGDINGDGGQDLFISANGSGTSNSGRIYVVYGAEPPVIFNGTARSEIFSGRSNDDRLYGNGGNDTLSGLVGDDLIEGGDGGDKLYGEAGSDRLDGGAGSDRIEGGAGADTLFGGEGHDHLDGGADGDTMTGGTGNDLYFVDSLGDVVIELAGEGTDVVRTALNNWVLADNLEAVELQGVANLDLTGNAASTRLQGNGGDNRLSGLGGVDTLNGEDGDDIIVGGTGNDIMRGGLGADVFMVLNESIAAPLETDQVYDFSTAEGDTIDLSGIDAILGGADDAFTLVGAFSKAAGQMTLTFAGGITTLRLDVTGDGKVDYQMKINGDVTGDSGGWLL